MKIYTWVITIMLSIFLGYNAILYVIKNNNLPQEIAVFDDSKKQPKMFKLNYSKNGDLIFSTVKLQSSIPRIIHWDYYGSTEVTSYIWENQNTILIETKDSNIKIVIPEFAVVAK